MLSPILAVADIDASVEFYVQKLGFSKNWSIPDATGKTDFASVQLGDAEILLGVLEGYVEPEDLGKRGIGVQIYIELSQDLKVDDIYDKAKNGGANIIKDIADCDWGERVFTVKDIDGYHLMIAQRIKKENS
jgi:uncharacterized glyoxalase superfamily protein PhnB